MVKQQVVLVDKNNRKIGVEEKIKAHKEGKLHRAFSIFIFNSNGKLLIQQRAKTKYHSGGLWSNTICGHPKPNETYQQAVHRRLKEEMGFDCKLKKLFCFIYNTRFQNGLIENEYDCVFIGKYDGKPKPNHKEVMNYKLVSIDDLQQDIKKKPSKYTFWFKIALQKLILYIITDGKIPKKKSPSKIMYNAYFNYMKETSKIVDSLIIQMLKTFPKDIKNILIEAFHNRVSKKSIAIPKLRSLSTRLGYEIVGGKNWKKIAPVCAIMELVDTSTYAADDILDLNITDKNFIEKRLISSHLLKDLSLRMVYSLKKSFSKDVLFEVIKRIVELTEQVYKGFYFETKIIGRFSMKNYMERVKSFTFWEYLLFVAGLLGGGTKEQISALEKFGKNIGIAYMLANDACDFAKTCEDIRGNKITLPIFYALKKAGSEDKKILKRVLGNWNASKEELEKIKRIVVKTGAINYTKNYAIKYLNKGIKHLSIFPETKQKRLLVYTTRIVTNNKYYKELEKHI